MEKILDFCYSDPAMTVVVKPVEGLLDWEPSHTTKSLPLLLKVPLTRSESPQ